MVGGIQTGKMIMNLETKVTEFWGFVQEKNRLPKKSVREERNLYELCTMVSSDKNNAQGKIPEVWDQMRKMGWKTAEEKRREREKEFCDYLDAHGVCLPQYGAANYDRVKQFLYRLKNNVGDARQKYPEAWARMEGKELGFLSPRKNMEKEFWEFVNTQGRLPVRSDKNAKTLYQWCLKVVRNKTNLKDRYPDVWEKMKSLSLLEPKSGTSVINRADEFWDFVKKNGRLPKYSIPEEKSLYLWCGKVFSKYSDRLPEVCQKMKEIGWGVATLNEKMDRLVSFAKENGRLPAHYNTKERVLYTLCKHLAKNKDGLRDKYPDVWEKLAPYVKPSRGENEQEALITFTRKFNRLPKPSDKGYINLYQWCLRLARNENMQKMYPKAYKALLQYK